MPLYSYALFCLGYPRRDHRVEFRLPVGCRGRVLAGDCITCLAYGFDKLAGPVQVECVYPKVLLVLRSSAVHWRAGRDADVYHKTVKESFRNKTLAGCTRADPVIIAYFIFIARGRS